MPKAKPKAKHDEQRQSDAFIEAARELEADREAEADALLGKLAEMKPEPRGKKNAPADEKPEPGHSKTGTRSPD